MKRIRLFLFLAVLMTAAACQNTIRYEYNPTDGKITVLAQMSTGEAQHSILLSMSYPDRTEGIPDASVRCTVNGNVYQAVPQQPDTDWGDPGYTRYVFEAPLQAGDKVSVEARCGDRTAHASLSVPPAAGFSVTDTTTLVQTLEVHNYDGEVFTLEYRNLQVQARVRDIPGEDSFFALGVKKVFRITHVFLDDVGRRTRPDSVSIEWNDYFWTRRDPILDDGYFSETGDDGDNLLDGLLASNSMHCFSDQLFRDGEGTITFLVSSEDRPYTTATYADVEVSLELHLLSISRSCYNYLRALNNMETYGYEVTPIIEPTMLPSNVEDGLGLVSVGTDTPVVLQLDPMRIKGDAYYWLGY